MRTPDTTESIQWHGQEVIVSTWVDPTEFPWDGDCELEPGTEGFDILVRTRLEYEGQVFIGQSSIGGNWGDNEYIREQVKEVERDALGDLAEQLSNCSEGEGVLAAQKRSVIAHNFLMAW